MSSSDELTSLRGKLLIAMPQMSDSRFAEAVIYLCEHTPEGAMGLVINKDIEVISMTELMGQLSISIPEPEKDRLTNCFVGAGGPVEQNRGFILHSNEYLKEESLAVSDQLAMTATLEILQDIANGQGPASCLIALGYSGWSELQLDRELQENAWLIVDADQDLLFNHPRSEVWSAALAKLGISPELLSSEIGRA